MKNSQRKPLALAIVRKFALKFVLVIALLSTATVTHATQGFFWGYLSNGDTAWLWCGSGGNYWTRCETGSCPPGESCPCHRCDTSDCQETADYYCGEYLLY